MLYLQEVLVNIVITIDTAVQCTWREGGPTPHFSFRTQVVKNSTSEPHMLVSEPHNGRFYEIIFKFRDPKRIFLKKGPCAGMYSNFLYKLLEKNLLKTPLFSHILVYKI